MTDVTTYRAHARAALNLGLPLVGSHLAQLAITLTDALMLGWYSVEALAAEVLGGTLFFVLFTQVVLWVTVAAVGLNVVVNYALIFGNWGAPEMGVRGAAVASLVVTSASFVALAVYAAKVTPEHALFRRVWRPDWEAFGQVFRLGWPIGMTSLAEVSLFAASTVMMGWLGTIALAAHGIALQVSSVTFMVHLGLSNAATIRAGNAFGRGDGPGLRDGAKVVLALSGVFAAVTVVLFLTLPEPMIAAFLNPDEPERDAVVAVGVGLLAAAALFQLVDAAQVMALGLLRGVQDTRVPMLIAVVSYWIVGVPVSYAMGFWLDWGGVGIWLGLAVGLALAGVFLMWRFWWWSGRNVAARVLQESRETAR
ncbi:MATE family efflux transporter [Roseovarius sp. SK2]|uniref:MATE family efflux transporter n=1 Tax=Roseovarius TaxID=74030 RepID=UPI00237B7AC8|nr:MATE family efflux transporter [Roseovarius sp. SK2]MDD9726275.1 MATE family efflux transporter [Roseovarius sp. SK2]